MGKIGEGTGEVRRFVASTPFLGIVAVLFLGAYLHGYTQGVHDTRRVLFRRPVSGAGTGGDAPFTGRHSSLSDSDANVMVDKVNNAAGGGVDGSPSGQHAMHASSKTEPPPVDPRLDRLRRASNPPTEDHGVRLSSDGQVVRDTTGDNEGPSSPADHAPVRHHHRPAATTEAPAETTDAPPDSLPPTPSRIRGRTRAPPVKLEPEGQPAVGGDTISCDGECKGDGPSDDDFLANAWLRKVADSVKKAKENPEAPDLIPAMVVPLFMDHMEVKALLGSIDVPVRLFCFSWNSNTKEMRGVLETLIKLPYGVKVNHFPHNIGFSGAVNAGMKSAMRLANASWFFIVNADSEFPPGNLKRFATKANAAAPTHGLIYGPRQDHFAFAITRLAVETVGLLDEVFFPGYMEDIDFHWRCGIAGLPQMITKVKFVHKTSSNLKKRGAASKLYRDQLTRSSRGWEYGWMKWGKYPPVAIERTTPPSGWKTPFNIPDAPLGLWAIDPGHRNCIRTGKGHYHIRSTTCWYNGTVLLEYLPEGTTLPLYLRRPGVSGRNGPK